MEDSQKSTYVLIVLLEFRVQNYRSIRDPQEFSLVAGPGKEHRANLIEAGSLRLLRGAVLYGPNASGKSNLLRAMQAMQSFVLSSPTLDSWKTTRIYDPFCLDPAFATDPARFEILFLHEDVRHQYGFVLHAGQVKEEWLIAYPKGSPQRWFERVAVDGKARWSFSPHLKGDRKGLSEKTRDDALFLSVGAQWNHPQLQGIFKWFQTQLLNMVQVAAENAGRVVTGIMSLEDESSRSRVMRLMQGADLGIRDLQIERPAATQGADSAPGIREPIPWQLEFFATGSVKMKVHLLHSAGAGAPPVPISLDDESDGTQRYFRLAGPCLNALAAGATLLVDELNNNLHPVLCRRLIELFLSPEHNPKGAQLVFTTHDTSLLDHSLFRRDQIWFTEKDARGGTNLYPLSDYKVRLDEALQKGYLAGRYGAVPLIGRLAS